jgi:transcriptional regulator GlxA family with amidase domain
MQQVVILGFDGALASAITGVVDLFAMAGVSWNRIQQQDVQRLFKVSIASPDGHPIRCINGLQLQAHVSYQEIQTADILVVPTIAAPIQDVLQQNPELIHFLKSAHAEATLIAGNCTGNFFLAEAGILDDRIATTHWGFQEVFRSRYPKVKLNADLMISRDQNIYCAGGGLAWFDLGLHLIERLYGFEVAMQSAKSFVIDYRRGEIERLGPLVLDAANILHHKYPDYTFLIPAINDARKQQIESLLATYPESLKTQIRLMENTSAESKIGRQVMNASNIIALASGTATLEAMLLHRPMVTFYKLHWLTYRIAKLLVKIPYFSLPNIIAGKKVIQELIQSAATPENLAAEIEKLMDIEAAQIQVMQHITMHKQLLSGNSEDPVTAVLALVQ